MRVTVEDVLKQALTLDEKERASVAGALIESLHPEAEPDTEEAWDSEIRRRVEELDSGAVETIPWSDVRKRLFSGFE
jgi:putative addiction module component (TIGR02574 family)